MFEARFQTFDDTNSRAEVASRVAALRAELARRGLDGLIVPRADSQQNEYVPPSEERLAWLTGFTGSAGAAIVLADAAALFVDGRYTVQVRDQTDTTVFSIEHYVELPPDQWLRSHLKAGQRFGYDPWLHTADGAEKLTSACAAAGATLAPCDTNPVDGIWRDRPAPSHGAVTIHPDKFAGEIVDAKLRRIADAMTEERLDVLILSDPHAVAWAFNIRGADVSHTPLPLAYALIRRSGRPSLYVDERKLGNSVRARLEEFCDVRAPGDLARDVAALGGQTVRLDRATASDALTRMASDAGARLRPGTDPVALMKAIKNDTEIAGARAAQRRDGAAMARFLAWLDREAPNGALTEIGIVAALETFRRDTGALKDVSFPTISGSGPNGAIVHYRVTRATDRRIAPGDMVLVDSGAQYEDGTTDITRTVIVGSPTAEMRDRFTRVLKGHIAIAMAVFPDGTSGAQLDPRARDALWQAGLDFDHGTGHGVGSYLSVHEGPARISKLGNVALRRGMILSNEPGYYKAGAYGIRIENLVLVVAGPQPAGAEKTLNAFETLTLAPIDQRLIDPTMLNAGERSWIDAYHRRVRDGLAPLVDAATADWLGFATKPLSTT